MKETRQRETVGRGGNEREVHAELLMSRCKREMQNGDILSLAVDDRKGKLRKDTPLYTIYTYIIYLGLRPPSTDKRDRGMIRADVAAAAFTLECRRKLQPRHGPSPLLSRRAGGRHATKFAERGKVTDDTSEVKTAAPLALPFVVGNEEGAAEEQRTEIGEENPLLLFRSLDGSVSRSF
nr:hypothetical protein Iba_chr10bCG8740 [Ipomoea batatas]